MDKRIETTAQVLILFPLFELECTNRALFFIHGRDFGADAPIVEFQDQGTGKIRHCFHRIGKNKLNAMVNGTEIQLNKMTMADCEILEWEIDDSNRHNLLKVVLPTGHGQIFLRVIVAGTRYSNAMNIKLIIVSMEGFDSDSSSFSFSFNSNSGDDGSVEV